MAESFVSELDRILRWLTEHGRPAAKRLRSGLNPDAIFHQLASVGMSSPADVVELYSWRNGTDTSMGDTLDDIHFFPGYYFLSLEDAVEHYLTVRSDTRWRSGWLPVFANGGGDFYVADLLNSKPDGTPIIGFMLNANEQPVYHESVNSLISTLAECFDRCIVAVTHEGYLDWDDLKYFGVAKRHNPQVRFWNGA